MLAPIFSMIRSLTLLLLFGLTTSVYAACDEFTAVGLSWNFDLDGGLNGIYGDPANNGISIDVWARRDTPLNYGQLGKNYYVLAEAIFNASGSDSTTAYCNDNSGLNWDESPAASSEYYYVIFNKDVYARRMSAGTNLSFPLITSSTEANGYAQLDVYPARRCAPPGCTNERYNIGMGGAVVDGRFGYGVAMYLDRETPYKASLASSNPPPLPPKAYLYASQINTPGMTGGRLGAYTSTSVIGGDQFPAGGSTIGPYGSAIYYPIGDPMRGRLASNGPFYHRIAACNKIMTSCSYGGLPPGADSTYEKKKYVFLLIVYKLAPFPGTNTTYGRIDKTQIEITPFNLFNTEENRQLNAPVVVVETQMVNRNTAVVQSSLAMCV